MKGKSDARLFSKKDWTVEEIQNWIILRRRKQRSSRKAKKQGE